MNDFGPTTVELLDSGYGRKLERFGDYVLARPCSQAVWKPRLPRSAWDRADASFDREDGQQWHNRSVLPDYWDVQVEGQRFRLSDTDFGHLGIFPEQRAQWHWIRERVASRTGRGGSAPGVCGGSGGGEAPGLRARGSTGGTPPALCGGSGAGEAPGLRGFCSVLNLFAYSGGSTIAAALAGASVCHLDASKGMVDWAHENARINDLADHPIRWIPEDAHKFLCREQRRGRRYDGIVLDPPTFGRGKDGEMYKIERDLPETLRLCRELLSDRPLFLLLSAHTPGFSPVVLGNLLGQALDGLHPRIESGEMLLTGGPDVLPLPSGAFARATFA